MDDLFPSILKQLITAEYQMEFLVTQFRVVFFKDNRMKKKVKKKKY